MDRVVVNVRAMRVLFLAKHKPFVQEAAALVRASIKEADIYFGVLADPFPAAALQKEYDYVISYISPWIVPKEVLTRTRIAAINLHPGPPEYPGVGCTNFAIYNGAREFGITVHHMLAKVDSGSIIMVKRFPIMPNDTVYSLTQRCYEHIYAAFMELLPHMVNNTSLPQSAEHWARKPYTRKELNELCHITKDMSDEEIRRRVRATIYPGMPGAYIELSGTKFVVEPPAVP